MNLTREQIEVTGETHEHKYFISLASILRELSDQPLEELEEITIDKHRFKLIVKTFTAEQLDSVEASLKYSPFFSELMILAGEEIYGLKGFVSIGWFYLGEDTTVTFMSGIFPQWLHRYLPMI